MDVYEFIGKMAEQHKSLLKVVDLQNNSIQSLNNRLNALSATQLIVFALLLELNKTERKEITRHLHGMLDNPQIAGNPHLVAQLKEFLEVCEDSRAQRAEPQQGSGTKAHPSWFKGIVQGGLSLLTPDKGGDEVQQPRSSKD